MEKSIAEEIRKFNRFYMSTISVFDSHSVHPELSSLVCRILYEIEEGKDITAKEIADIMHLDRGYLSRTLTRLEKLGCIVRDESGIDRRCKHLRLTDKGRADLELSIENANDNTQYQFGYLSKDQLKQVVGAMQFIQSVVLSNKCNPAGQS